MAEYLSIGQAAAAARTKVETIRYYEAEKLLPSPRRSSGGHRLYSAQLVRRLKFIRRARELGFPMTEIRGLLGIVDRDKVTCDQVKAMADEHISNIRSKIADLRRIEATLVQLSADCSGKEVPECPIIEALELGLPGGDN